MTLILPFDARQYRDPISAHQHGKDKDTNKENYTTYLNKSKQGNAWLHAT